jgi:cold shock CspA family protein
MTGVVERWGDKGFGIIRSDEGEEFYVHCTAVQRPYHDRDLVVGERVEFDARPPQRGRLREAFNVTLVPTSPRRFDP